jgi:hypothetical protein
VQELERVLAGDGISVQEGIDELGAICLTKSIEMKLLKNIQNKSKFF